MKCTVLGGVSKRHELLKANIAELMLQAGFDRELEVGHLFSGDERMDISAPRRLQGKQISPSSPKLWTNSQLCCCSAIFQLMPCRTCFDVYRQLLLQQ